VDLAEFPGRGIVEVRRTPTRTADRNIAAISKDGVYQTAEHRVQLQARADTPGHADDIVDAHVRRLEALRRAGIVERQAEGIWRISADLVARGQDYDRQRTGGVSVQLHSQLPIDKQVTALGATWLDQRLIDGNTPIANVGFGASVKEALRKRVDFLVEHGFVRREGNRLNVRSSLLATLRERDLESVARSVAAENGRAYRPRMDGERITGIYRRLVVTSSGRFAMLDDGQGFSLVLWHPVLEQRIGQQLAATLRGDRVTWSFGRRRGLSR
jgi:hypothetical protein